MTHCLRASKWTMVILASSQQWIEKRKDSSRRRTCNYKLRCERATSRTHSTSCLLSRSNSIRTIFYKCSRRRNRKWSLSSSRNARPAITLLSLRILQASITPTTGSKRLPSTKTSISKSKKTCWKASISLSRIRKISWAKTSNNIKLTEPKTKQWLETKTITWVGWTGHSSLKRSEA